MNPPTHTHTNSLKFQTNSGFDNIAILQLEIFFVRRGFKSREREREMEKIERHTQRETERDRQREKRERMMGRKKGSEREPQTCMRRQPKNILF